MDLVCAVSFVIVVYLLAIGLVLLEGDRND